MFFGILLICLGLPFKFTLGQLSCDQRATCGECIASADCLWCSDEATSQRCYNRRQEHSCSNLQDPRSRTNVTEAADLSLDSTGDIIQISPQSVSLHLRVGETTGHRLEFEISQSSEYPVDLYFLLDLSWSMDKSRNNFAEQAGEIIRGIKNLTSNVRFGFGSFVEKNLPPFTSAVPSFHCPKENPKCTPPYSFYHHTTLSEISPEDLKREVLAAPLAGNVDEPEGGLDGLMQAMVCKERLGWRPDSRKLILMATDRDFHYAMDGKLVGILDRNDGLCHLSGEQGQPGSYNHSELLDYPSISHINAVAQASSFVLLFTVIPRYHAIWQSMSRLIPGSSVEMLEDDAQNMLEIIRTRYEEITSTIRIKLENVPDDVFVKIKSKCRDANGPEQDVDFCSDVELGTPVKFVAEVRVRACLEEPKTFTISPLGLDQSLEVEVNTLCQCECERPGHAGFVPNSPDCSRHGSEACGICQCDDGYFGQACECDSNALSDADDPKSSCRDPTSPNLICNGRGSCQCGVCQCFDRPAVYGQFCDCDDVTCVYGANGQLCSGKGDCRCGTCQCRPGWSGVDCSCDQRVDRCMSPYNGLSCSGQGQCECNQCRCGADDKGRRFSGPYCEMHPDEVNPCAILKDCAECLAFATGAKADADECSRDCGHFEYAQVPRDNMTQGMRDEKPCEFENSDGCLFAFSSFLEDGNSGRLLIALHLNEEGAKETCPPPLTMAISLGVFLTILLLGLATLLVYKCYITIDDRREYAHFEKEQENVFYAGNEMPNELYLSPITETKSPMHGKAFPDNKLAF